MLRSRSAFAPIFCFGITSTSRQCQTSTPAGSSAFCVPAGAAIVALRAKHGEVGVLLPPREAAVDRRRLVEDAQGAALRVVQLDAVAGLVFSRDRNGQKASAVLPR